MQMSITGRHIELSTSLRERVKNGIDELISKYFGKAQEASATFDKENQQFKATLSIHVGKGLSFQAVGIAADAYSSTEQALQHLGKQLRRNKRRLREDHNRPKVHDYAI